MKIEVLYGSRDEIVFRNEIFFSKMVSFRRKHPKINKQFGLFRERKNSRTKKNPKRNG